MDIVNHVFILLGVFKYFSQFNKHATFFLSKCSITHWRFLLSRALKVYIVYWDTRGLSNVSGVYEPKGCSEMGWSMNSLKLYKHLWICVFSGCLCWVRQGVVENKVPLFSFSKGSVIHQNLESTSLRELNVLN